MSSSKEEIATFCEITSCRDSDQAFAILESFDGDLEAAIAYYFDNEKAISKAGKPKLKRGGLVSGGGGEHDSVLFAQTELAEMNLILPSRSIGMMDLMPFVLVQRVISFLKVRDFARFCATAKHYQTLIHDPAMWEKFYWRLCAPSSRLFWNFTEQECPHELPEGLHAGDVRSMCMRFLNESNGWLSSRPAKVTALFEYANKGPADLRDESTKKSKSPYKADESERITALHARGMWCAYASRAHKMSIRDTRNGKLIRVGDTAHAEISALEFTQYQSPNASAGSVILMGGSKDGSVMFWDLQNAKDPLVDSQMHTRPVHAIKCGRQWGVSGGVDGAVFGYYLPGLIGSQEPPNNSFWRFAENVGSVESILLDTEESFVVVGGTDRSLSVFPFPHVVDGRLVPSPLEQQLPQTLVGHTASVVDMCWVRGSRIMASCAKDHSARVWDLSTGQCMALFDRHANMVNKVRSVDSIKLFTACEDKLVRRFDIEYAQLEAKYACGNFGPAMMEVDRMRIVTASTREPFLHIFDPRSEKRAGYLFPNAALTLGTRADGQPLGNVSEMRILDDTRLLVGHKDGAVYLYDFRRMT
eukprot:ANDGO_07666.mRNA.1 F-box/WD repeat-containing protein pof1